MAYPKGKPASQERKEKIRQAWRAGRYAQVHWPARTAWNKGKTGYHLRMTDQVRLAKNPKIGQAHRGKNLSVEHREKLSVAHKGQVPQSAQTGKHPSLGRHPWNYDPDTRLLKQCECCKEPFRIPPNRADSAKYCSVRCPKQDTKIERALQKGLQEMGLGFRKQVPILGVTRADIALTDRKIAIFADGDYWHSRPEIASRDTFQTMMLSANGWNVLRFSETKIKTELACLQDIRSAL